VEIGSSIGDAFISIGLVIQAIVMFLVVAFVLFLIIKAYTRTSPSPMRRRRPRRRSRC
jgi:large-conductance mechanosensitive channel